MYIFQGWNNYDFFDDMYYLQLDCEPKRWVRVHQNGEIPKRRHDHGSAVYDNIMYIWTGTGGFNDEGEWIHYNDMHEFDLETNSWIAHYSLEGPPPTESHSAILYDHCK